MLLRSMIRRHLRYVHVFRVLQISANAMGSSAPNATKPLRVLAWPKLCGNPYNELLYGEIERHGVHVDPFTPFNALLKNYDIFHIHWPEVMFNQRTLPQAIIRAISSFIVVTVIQLRGAKIVWTAHDLQEHEVCQPLVRIPMWAWYLRQVKGLITLTAHGYDLVVEKYPRLKDVLNCVIPHGHYRDAYPNTISREDARGALGIDPHNEVLLFFGSVKVYKNVPHLIRLFQTIEDPNYRLIVAGLPLTEELREEVLKAAEEDDRIILDLRMIPEDEIQTYMNACDLVVLPFRAILNSGSTHLALSYERHVLIPNIGSLKEVAELYGPSWISIYQGELTVETIMKAVARAKALEPGHISFPKETEWPDIAAKTVRMFSAVHESTS